MPSLLSAMADGSAFLLDNVDEQVDFQLTMYNCCLECFVRAPYTVQLSQQLDPALDSVVLKSFKKQSVQFFGSCQHFLQHTFSLPAPLCRERANSLSTLAELNTSTVYPIRNAFFFFNCSERPNVPNLVDMTRISVWSLRQKRQAPGFYWT